MCPDVPSQATTKPEAYTSSNHLPDIVICRVHGARVHAGEKMETLGLKLKSFGGVCSETPAVLPTNL